MEHVALQIASLVTVVRQKRVYIAPEVFANQGRNLGRKYDAETFLGYVPAHHFFRGGIKDGASSKNLGPRRGMAILELWTGDNHGGGAIGGESRRDQVRDRQVFALQSQRAKLNRDQCCGLLWIGANVIGGARDSSGAGHAA